MTRNRLDPTGRWTRLWRAGCHDRVACAAVVAVAAVTTFGTVAAPVAGQTACDEQAGTLGIQGLRCEGCTYRMSESGIEEARFRTEPEVLALARGFTQGDPLEAGDRIVAIDGALITTLEGSDRLVALRAGQRVTVRVRRDGRVEDLAMVAGSACELRRRLEKAEVEVEGIAVPGVRWGHLPPPPATAPLPPLPSIPALPPMPALPPSAYLGFGLKCGPCGVRDGVRFFDDNPPVVTSVVEHGPADEAGLQAEDVILAVDGFDITTVEGGRRFSEIEPGDRVELTVRRGDERRTLVLEAGDRVARREPPGAMPAPRAAVSDELRFEGQLGDVSIEVRGRPVTVTRDEATGELVIQTAGNLIRIRPGG
jgi:membrane-associated protease RseP (regulator of RpoE activity)